MLFRSDSIEPLLEVCRRSGAGLFVLVRTSNPGSAMFQHHGEPPLVHLVAREVARWGEALRGECGLSSVGAVVGATHAGEIGKLRALMPFTPFPLYCIGSSIAFAMVSATSISFTFASLFVRSAKFFNATLFQTAEMSASAFLIVSGS